MKQKEYMTELQILLKRGYKRQETTTNMSKNESFEKNGYLFIPELISDPENLYCSPPLNENGDRLTGQLNFIRKDKFTYDPDEKQVKWFISTI